MAGFVTDAKGFLLSAGYADSDLIPDYHFSKPDSGSGFTHEIADLVAFSGRPHTIRTACVGVVDGPAQESQSKLAALRYLGAPFALVGSAEDVSLLALRIGEPAEVEKSERADWQNRFQNRLAVLSPESIGAAKAGFRQLTFFDPSLGEWAEQISEQSVIRLLGSLFQESISGLTNKTRKAEEAVIRMVCHLFACRVLEDKMVLQPSNTPTATLAAAQTRYPDRALDAFTDLTAEDQEFFRQFVNS